MDRDKQINAGRQVVKMRLKDAIQATRAKENMDKYKYTFISFSFVVGPQVSATERIVEYVDGRIRCDFAFIVNKKYDMNKYGSRRICIDRDKMRRRYK